MVYKSSMLPQKPSAQSHLTRLREQAGLTVRELARQLGTAHTNVMYWERAGKVAKTEFVAPMAKAFGAKVFTTAGSAEKCAACVKLGADRAINYKEEDFVEVIKAETGGKGVDVVLDIVAGPYAQSNIEALARDGRYVIIGFLQGWKAEFDLRPVLARRISITGSLLRPQTVEEKAAIARSVETSVLPLLESGAVKPHVYATFPLARAADAHTLMESSRHMGKIVLEVS